LKRPLRPTTMDIHHYDSATMFRLVLRGELIGQGVQSLERVWNVAKSVLARKEFIVDISGVTTADPLGLDLLNRMRDLGAHLTAALPPEPPTFVRSVDLQMAAHGRRGRGAWAVRLLEFAGVLSED